MPKTDLLQLRIKLLGTEPCVWRELIVSSRSTFFDLHAAIQDAFEWEDAHLHQFFIDDPYKRRMELRRISLPALELDLDSEKPFGDERKMYLPELLRKPKDKAWYEYDFGDSWMHEITLQKILPYKKGDFPVLLDGANARPPEDSGGIGGYANLLDILAHPKNPAHKDMLDWLGIRRASEFHLNHFDKTRIRFRDPKKYLKTYFDQLEI